MEACFPTFYHVTLHDKMRRWNFRGKALRGDSGSRKRLGGIWGRTSETLRFCRSRGALTNGVAEVAIQLDGQAASAAALPAASPAALLSPPPLRRRRTANAPSVPCTWGSMSR